MTFSRRPGTPSGTPARGKPALTLIAMALASMTAFPAVAQQAAANAAPAKEETVTEELIRMLAKHNALSKEDAATLLKRLQGEKAAPAQASAPAAAPAQPVQAQTAAPAATAAAPAAAGAPAEAAAAADAQKKGDVHVVYIPEGQKQKLREEIKQDLLAEEKKEGWTQRNDLPEWISRIKFSGDFRFRNEWDLYDPTNGLFVNYQAINAGSPYDVNAANSGTTLTPPPTINTTQDRERPRIRARIQMDAKVADDLTAGFRFSTGNDNNPVTTDQTLGGEGSADSGDFNRPVFYIDRAYLKYDPARGLSLWAGRMPDLWLAPTNLAWYQDLGFDGGALQYVAQPSGGIAPFVTLGAFSVENTSLSYPSTGISKVASRDKWMFGGQVGFTSTALPGLEVKEGLAYYYFNHIQGQLSSPCYAYSATDSCDTDDSRPGFLQGGNTLFYIRNLLPNPNVSNPALSPQYEYFGLASAFHELDFSMQLDKTLSGSPLHLIFAGEAVLNLGYNRNKILNEGPSFAKGPQNNFGACVSTVPNATCVGPYDGGDLGAQVQLTWGYPQIKERWQWAVTGGYRYLESDAVVDAFTDSDFHLGGTNAKGYYLRGSLGFTHNAWLEAKWFSATEVSGPPLSIDVLQFDINARF